MFMFRNAATWVSLGQTSEPRLDRDFRRADKGYDEGEASASLFVVKASI
jgi:hypothetical protein